MVGQITAQHPVKGGRMIHFGTVGEFVQNHQVDQRLGIHRQMPGKIEVASRIAGTEAFPGAVDRDCAVIDAELAAELLELARDDAPRLPPVKCFQRTLDDRRFPPRRQQQSGFVANQHRPIRRFTPDQRDRLAAVKENIARRKIEPVDGCGRMIAQLREFALKPRSQPQPGAFQCFHSRGGRYAQFHRARRFYDDGDVTPPGRAPKRVPMKQFRTAGCGLD
ncbi:hypothetical protein SDC9_89388 [bioreactor metagenome]|uniref:Uncharacterized protein n=1 Tax=bioreactor metagenome TaxID=1076179 RepID=A0A644ZP31_9ZZZZ